MGADLYRTVFQLYTTPLYYFSIIMVPVICLWRDFTWKFIYRTDLPQSYHIVQEIQKIHEKAQNASKKKICILFTTTNV